MKRCDLARQCLAGAMVLCTACAASCTAGEDYAGGEPIVASTDASPDGKGGSSGKEGGVEASTDVGGSAQGGAAGAAGSTTAGAGGSAPNLCGNGKCDPGETCGSCAGSSECCCGNGTCDPGEFCGSCGTECCCGNGTCEPGEVCGSCGTECCCGNGTCDPGEVCGGCGTECCCGNGTCDNGEVCGSCGFECCGQCRARCCDGSLVGPVPMAHGDLDGCFNWGPTGCGSADNFVRADLDGTIRAQQNRCWYKCTGWTTYHLLPGIDSGCAAEADAVCKGANKSLIDAAWQYCDPNKYGVE